MGGKQHDDAARDNNEPCNKTLILLQLNKDLKALIDSGHINVDFIGDTPAKCELMHIGDARRHLYTIMTSTLACLKKMNNPHMFILCDMCLKSILDFVVEFTTESRYLDNCEHEDCYCVNVNNITWHDTDIFGNNIISRATPLTKEGIVKAIKF